MSDEGNRKYEQGYEQGYKDGGSSNWVDWQFAIEEFSDWPEGLEVTPHNVAAELQRLYDIQRANSKAGDRS